MAVIELEGGSESPLGSTHADQKEELTEVLPEAVAVLEENVTHVQEAVGSTVQGLADSTRFLFSAC